MTKLIIFDMDGTLIDTDKVLIETWTEMFDDFLPGYPYTDELFVSFSGPSLKATIDKFFDGMDKEEVVKVYNQRTGKYYDMYASLFEKEVENLRKIKELGYKFAIVTNKIRERTIYCLKLLGLEEFFDFAVCGDDVKVCKPDPEGLIRVLKHYDVKPEDTLYVGDTEYDYFAAKNANIKCILMTNVPRVYEHGDEVKPYKFVKDYDELYEEIKKYEASK